MNHRKIPEFVVPDKPLGRHVEHDPRSREYPVRLAKKAVTLRTKHHRRYGRCFNQQDLGSCTGMATAGLLNTMPIHKVGRPLLMEPKAVAIYSLATQLDPWDGEYPPTDTGSSGLAAGMAAKQLGYIKEVRHAFGIDEALQVLQYTAVMTGIDWLEGFDEPTEQGFIKMEGQVRGGHEFEVKGYVAGTKPYVVCEQSWGPGFGKNGIFKMWVKDWAASLEAQGDVTVLVR